MGFIILFFLLLCMFKVSHNKKLKKKWEHQRSSRSQVFIELGFQVLTMFFPLLDMLSSSASSPAPDPAPESDPAPAPVPAVPQPSKMAKPFGYGYPTLQPGYQNAAAPLSSGVQPSSPVYSGFQPYAQVCM